MTDALPYAKQIVGYCDPLAAAPGQEIGFHVSCEPAVRRYHARIVRMLSGDPRPGGPGLRSAPVADIGQFPGHPHPVSPGSYLAASGPSWPASESGWSLLTLVWPSRAEGSRQVLVAAGDPWDADGAALYLDAELRPGLMAGAGEASAGVRLDDPLALRRWYALLGWCSPSGEIQVAVRTLDGPWQASSSAPVLPRRSGTARAQGPITVGALLSDESGRPQTVTRHFTGRLERPAVIGAALDTGGADELLRCRPEDLPGLLASRENAVLYDLSTGIDTWTATDVGPGGCHATAHNTPIRAVRGSHWEPGSTDWREAPGQYGAMHFNADAIEDCAWPAAFGFTVPAGLASGFYAAHVSGDGGEDYIPFFVRPPAAAAATAPVLLIAPTATYAAYGNSRFWWEDPIQECVQDRLVDLGAEEQYLIGHPEMGASSYDQHLDGTDVCYVSWRRPNLNMRPGHARYEGYTCDLYLVDWLDRIGQDVDVVTDEIVHREGAGLLSRYPVVLTGTHPEYMSAAEFDAIEEYVLGGGRLMYMGGNGFASNVNFDQHRPWIIENRRVDFWLQDEDARQSEGRNSTDGMRGGDLRLSGRQSVRVTGVETATMGFDRSYPYHRQPGSRHEAAAFVFAGVTGDVLGDFGLLGGGVVGQEWDNSAGHELGPEFLTLAASRDHTLLPPLFGALKAQYHGELTLGFPGRGCVFSVSSMSWCGALSHEDYRNDIATITGNVLRRFLDPAPLVPPTEGTT